MRPVLEEVLAMAATLARPILMPWREMRRLLRELDRVHVEASRLANRSEDLAATIAEIGNDL